MHVLWFWNRIEWMKYKSPNDSNRKDIEKYLLDTQPNRKEWILQESPTISQIFKEYQRLLDYNGDMVRMIIYQLMLALTYCIYRP